MARFTSANQQAEEMTTMTRNLLFAIALEAGFSIDYDNGNWRSCVKDGWIESRSALYVAGWIKPAPARRLAR
jgi:hypothetical protein